MSADVSTSHLWDLVISFFIAEKHRKYDQSLSHCSPSDNPIFGTRLVPRTACRNGHMINWKVITLSKIWEKTLMLELNVANLQQKKKVWCQMYTRIYSTHWIIAVLVQYVEINRILKTLIHTWHAGTWA